MQHGKSSSRLLRIACIVSVMAVAFVSWGIVRSNPEKAYWEFCYSEHRAEDQLMDPLILCGKNVIPLVTSSIKNPEMPRRLYAIHFLGNSRAVEALPTLRSILQSKEERDGIRAGALLAIAMIDLSEGKARVKGLRMNGGIIGDIANGILMEDEELLRRRTYFEALLRSHD